jgi:ABC-2 type transport system permease protein
MGALIKAEFRKILTTKLWWGLLIPAVVVGFGWAFFAAKLINSIAESLQNSSVLQQAGTTFQNVPWVVFALSRGINITTIFPMLFGALGLSTELQRRTITTSFLTASSRSALLGAKAVTYLIWGVIYGVLISAVATLGTIAGSSGHYLPDVGGILTIGLSGVVSSLLWTLLGLGVGALLGSTVGSIVLLLIYSVIAEPVLALVLRNHVAGALPNGSADGLTGSTAAQVIVDKLQTYSHAPLVQVVGQDTWNNFLYLIRIAAGAIGGYSTLVSGLIFAGWTAVFFGAGMLVNARRDVT